MTTCKYCDNQTMTPEMVICINHVNIKIEESKPKIVNIIRCQRRGCLTPLKTSGFCQKHTKKERVRKERVRKHTIGWTKNETFVLLDIYVNNTDTKFMVEKYFEQFPNSNRSFHAIEMKLYRIKTIDKTSNINNVKVVDEKTIDMCKLYNSDRF